MSSTFKLGFLAILMGGTKTVFAGCPFLSGQEVGRVRISTNVDIPILLDVGGICLSTTHPGVQTQSFHKTPKPSRITFA